MKNTKFLTSVLLFSILAFHAFGQTKVVVGTVRDENNKPIEFATVAVRNTTVATTTNGKGEYSIDVPKDGKVLVFTFVGKETIEEAIGNRTKVDVALIPAVSMLDDVVIVGYGTVKKSDLTGSVASIKSDEILRVNPVSLEQGLQGKIAGVQITQSDGAPGAGISIQVRGGNSLEGSTEPLYVIDGIPYWGNNGGSTPQSVDGDDKHSQNALSFLNPQDIESIEILKDASATAIYGSRGANGVVLITTKKGKKGEDKIEANFIDSYSTSSKFMKMLDAETYARLYNEASANANKALDLNLEVPYSGLTNPETGKHSPSPEEYRGQSKDWQRAIFRTAHSQNLTTTFSGGSDKGNYAISFDYYKQNGVILNSDFVRKTGRVNLSRIVKKWLTIGTNTSYAHSTSSSLKTGTIDGYSNSGVIRSALIYPPTLNTPYAPVGQLSPVRTIDPLTYINDVQNDFVADNFFSSNYVELTFLKQLKLRQNIGFNYANDVRNQYYPVTTSEGKTAGGKASQSGSTLSSLVSESILTYNQTWGDHALTVMGALVNESSIYSSVYAGSSKFANDILKSYNLSAGTVIEVPKNGRSPKKLMSMLGRINYAFKNRYLLTASFRRDGSSVFGRDNQWAAFPSFALAWKINEEKFIGSTFRKWSDIKLRLGYGVTGNQGISPYSAISRYTPAPIVYNGNYALGYALQELGNNKLRWESTEQVDFGVDLALPNRTVFFTFDWYSKTTRDLLQNVTLPSNSGFERQLQNIGSIQNSGFEYSVGAHIFDTGSFQWNIQANIYTNRNKIISLGEKKRQFAGRVENVSGTQPFIQQVGEANGRLYGYVENGFYNSEADVRADPAFKDATDATVKGKVGAIRFKDLDGKPGITNDDRTFIGDVNPKYSFGVTNNFTYKDFDLSIFISGVQGNDLINMNTYYMAHVGEPGGGNITQEMYDTRWTEANAANAKSPRPMANSGWHGESLRFSRRYVEDGSFVRLKNITLGFTVPLKDQPFIKCVRMYVGANNLYTITNYSGYDPEVNSFGQDPSLRGVDLGAYPQARTFLVGVKCTF